MGGQFTLLRPVDHHRWNRVRPRWTRLALPGVLLLIAAGALVGLSAPSHAVASVPSGPNCLFDVCPPPPTVTRPGHTVDDPPECMQGGGICPPPATVPELTASAVGPSCAVTGPGTGLCPPPPVAPDLSAISAGPNCSDPTSCPPPPAAAAPQGDRPPDCAQGGGICPPPGALTEAPDEPTCVGGPGGTSCPPTPLTAVWLAAAPDRDCVDPLACPPPPLSGLPCTDPTSCPPPPAPVAPKAVLAACVVEPPSGPVCPPPTVIAPAIGSGCTDPLSCPPPPAAAAVNWAAYGPGCIRPEGGGISCPPPPLAAGSGFTATPCVLGDPEGGTSCPPPPLVPELSVIAGGAHCTDSVSCPPPPRDVVVAGSRSIEVSEL